MPPTLIKISKQIGLFMSKGTIEEASMKITYCITIN